jgi:hypothetical protein
MRTLLAAVGPAAILGIAALEAARSTVAPGPAPARQLVVAELFTSEGCSSCPPADALLQRISADSPVDGVQVLALEEHVDYWDNLGWRDPFSSAAFTRRQSAYADRVFHAGEIYTPQLVVDGAFEAVGSAATAVRSALTRAAERPPVNVQLAATASGQRSHVEVTIDVPAAVKRKGAADILVAVVQDGLTSHVERGENRGRTLPHAAVVRSLTKIGELASGAPATSASGDVAIPPAPARVRVVAFIQERDSLQVLGAAAITPARR